MSEAVIITLIICGTILAIDIMAILGDKRR